MTENVLDDHATILIHADDRIAIAANLESPVYTIEALDDPQDFDAEAHQTGVALLITDDLAVCRAMQSQIACPILMIHHDIDAAFDAGATDCIPTAHATLLQQRTQQLIEQPPYQSYNLLPAMVFIADSALHLEYVNPQWIEKMGYTSSDIVGRTITELMSDVSKRVAPRLIEAFIQQPASPPFALRFRRHNGDHLDALLDITQKPNGHILGVMREITDLKAAEKSLRTSRNQLVSVLRALPEAVIMVDTKGNYLNVFSDDQMHPSLSGSNGIGQSLHETFPLDVADTLLEIVQTAITHGTVQETEYDLLNEDDISSYQAAASPMSENESVLILRDITNQRTIERTLVDSENKYRRLFENATDAIFIVDVMTGLIKQVNPQATLLLGYSQSEFEGMSIDEIESDEIAIQDEETVDLGQTNQLTIETQYRRQDGQYIDVEVGSRVLVQDKQLILISFVRDISERKRNLLEVEEQRNLAQALLNTANALNEVDSLDDVLDIILDSVRQIIPCDSANIMQISGNKAYVIRHIGYAEAGFASDDISRVVLPLNEASNLDWIIHHKKALRIDDTQGDNKFNWVDETTQAYIHSLITAPIITHGKVTGFINLDSTVRHNFSEQQELILMAFANQAAIAIHRASMIEALQLQTEILEKRVAERTRELLDVNETLQDAQAQLSAERNLLRLIIDTIPDPIYVKDAQLRFTIANRATVERIEGVEREEQLIGKSDIELYPTISSQLADEEQHILTTQTPQIDRSEVFHDVDGSIKNLIVTKVPLVDEDGQTTGIIGVNKDITQLREMQVRLRQVVNSARCLLWSATITRNRTTGYNYLWDYRVINEDAAQGFLPLYQEDVPYTTAWLDAIAPEDELRRQQMFVTTLASGNESYRLEYPLVLPDNTRYWLTEDVLLQSVDDNTWTATGVCTDISARKVVEEQLKEFNEELELRVIGRTLELSKINAQLVAQIEETERAEAAERQQRMIAETLREGVAQLTASLDRDHIFDSLLNLMHNIIPHDASSIMLIEDGGIKIVYVLGHNPDLLDLTYRVDNMPDIQQVQQTRRPLIIDDKRQFTQWQGNKDDWIRSVLIVPIVIDDEVIGVINLDSQHPFHFDAAHTEWMVSFGEQVGLAIRNAQYTTNLEAMVQQRTQELEFEKAQLNAILDGVTDGVIYTDMNRQPQYLNNALTTITDYTEEDWLSGLAQEEINKMSPPEPSSRWERILQWLENHEVWQGEIEIRRKDGSTFDAGLTRTIVKDPDGTAIGIVTVMRDISDEKRLAAQKARFITKAAHELRTPIANLKTRMYLMKRRPDKFNEHIIVADSVINLMQNLVEHMFDLSRFERGIMELAIEPISLSRFLQDVIQYQLPQAERQRIALKLDLPPDDIVIEADPYRLTQVITNLMGNALKYTANDRAVMIRVVPQGEMISIDVIDEGTGIAEEHLTKLFDPFYQASEDQSGIGLGLSIVNEIVKAHHGSVTVDSVLGEGTTFHIQLPITQAKDDTT